VEALRAEFYVLTGNVGLLIFGFVIVEYSGLIACFKRQRKSKSLMQAEVKEHNAEFFGFTFKPLYSFI
jgi:hypothetical protein